MNFKDIQKQVHKTSCDHGWHDNHLSFGDIIALCHSELSEALEEYRNGRYCVYFVDSYGYPNNDITKITEGKKPEGIAVEMADCIIRILDWAEENAIDMESIILMKDAYNKTRSYRHGNKII